MPAAKAEPCFPAELVEQLKEQLPEALFATLSGTMATYEKQFDTTRSELQYARLKIQVLEEHLRLRRIAKYGPGSEKLSNLQLEMLEEEPGVSRQEVAAESEREPLPAVEEEKKRKRRPHPGRQTLPADLPRMEKIIACTPEQCVCGNCGNETVVIGYEESEVLKVKRAEYYVEVSKREKRACKQKQCEEQGVEAAPLPARIIDKSLVSDQIIIDTIVSKYADHSPLYRQSAILLREAGVDISRATMCGWVMRVGEMLQPVVGAMRKELLAGNYIQADETPVDVQTDDKRGKNHQAYLWQYGTPGGATVFDFRMSRGREGPARFLGQFEGILQTDDYIAYERGIGGPKMVHAACWAHPRRRFVDAVKLNRLDAASIRAVKLMDDLFVIDREAREAQMDHTARHQLRQEKAPPLLDQIREHILATSKTVLPKSAVGKACSYTLTLWKKLTRFLEYPQLELSNNLAENSMRPVALGRKNWIHIGSEQAGPRVAAILSVVESCRRLKIPLRDYLGTILPGLANTSIQRVPELTPTAWIHSRT
ncbi:MAG: IS66 family transposase [Acidobacteria bacterium Pan2503]|uniref:IS66 family transposase n=1 Tax=Candidatus Acidiferrum panamense TaxID=2741543 RepID=A0A7V8NTQ1_9BACT|nr:IS66 family transposase [Candidatus Acidoferrum panamensis]